jgi:hypothetical protein
MPLVEHRLSPRVPVTLDALLEEPIQPATIVRLRNLSRDGAYAQTSVPIPRHRRVWIHLRVPGTRKPGVVTARIVRADANGVGLEFDDYAAETTALLDKLLTLAGEPANVSSF